MHPCRLWSSCLRKRNWGLHWLWLGWSYLDGNWTNVFLPPVRQTAYYIKECSQQTEGIYYPSSTWSSRGCTWDKVLGTPKAMLKHRSRYKRSVAYKTCDLQGDSGELGLFVLVKRRLKHKDELLLLQDDGAVSKGQKLWLGGFRLSIRKTPSQGRRDAVLEPE